MQKPLVVFRPIVFAAFSLVFAADAQAVTINWTPVGNPGNVPDTTIMQDGTTGYGSVGYSYNIDKYDVTNNQYTEFLNAKDPSGANALGLYSPDPVFGMANTTFGGINFNSVNADGSKYSVISGTGTHPVNYVNYYDALRFANWLNNGGLSSSDTETGAYTLLHDGSSTPMPIPSNGLSITRSAGEHIVIPTENEWYKAAYYDPKTGSYFQYGTSSNTLPTASAPTGAPNSANFNNVVGIPTNVGAYTGTTSPYGAFDMSGNMLQWNEALIDGSRQGLRGGSFVQSSILSGNVAASARNSGGQDLAIDHVGFRVAETPEPSTGVLAALGLLGLAAWGWRRRKRA